MSIRLEVFKDENAVGEAAARLIAAQIETKANSVLLLPTGRTPLPMYRYLVEWSQAKTLDLRKAKIFNLDEFYNLSPNHPGSYHRYMQQALFDGAGISAQNTHLLNGVAPDPIAECYNYEQKIIQAGGADLAVLGIGANGHIGFNEPGSTRESRTRAVEIRLETRATNAFLFENNLDAVPDTALTVGIATILEAREILLLATGSSKAQAVAQMLDGEISAELPASFLRLHPAVTLLLDSKAAAQIPEKFR